MEFIQVLTESQIALVSRLANEIWTEHFTEMIGSEQIRYLLDRMQSEEAIFKQIQDEGYVYYLIDVNEASVGYCSVAIQGEDLYLGKLYIKKSMRGRGIGRAVIDFIRDIALEKQLEKITLTVVADNAGAIAAYEKLGFVYTGTHVLDGDVSLAMSDYEMTLEV